MSLFGVNPLLDFWGAYGGERLPRTSHINPCTGIRPASIRRALFVIFYFYEHKNPDFSRQVFINIVNTRYVSHINVLLYVNFRLLRISVIVVKIHGKH